VFGALLAHTRLAQLVDRCGLSSLATLVVGQWRNTCIARLRIWSIVCKRCVKAAMISSMPDGNLATGIDALDLSKSTAVCQSMESSMSTMRRLQGRSTAKQDSMSVTNA
jgi:hypothetical protein